MDKLKILLLLLPRLFIAHAYKGGCGVVSAKILDIRQEAPWVAAIFQKSSSGNWVYLCGATITSDTTVITTANCVQSLVGSHERAHLRYSTLRVVAGLRSTNYSDRDFKVQEREVAQIREHRVPQDRYLQLNDRKANLAGVRLLRPFRISSILYPACLLTFPHSPHELLATAPGTVVTLAGYQHQQSLGFNPLGSGTFTVTELKLTSAPDCARKYEDFYLNVVCGKGLKDWKTNRPTVILCDMEGHGMVVQTDGKEIGQGKFYLMGVYTGNSARLKDSPDYPVYDRNGGDCTAEDVAFFTKYGEHGRWAISHDSGEVDRLLCYSDEGRPLAELCDGKANCKDGSDESMEVCYNQRDCIEEEEFRCAYGVCVNKTRECDGNWDCADGTDEQDEAKCREFDKRRNVTCPPLLPRRDLSRSCALPEPVNGQVPLVVLADVDCEGTNSLLVVGTSMTIRCAPNFIPENPTAGSNDSEYGDSLFVVGQMTVECLRNRSWSQEVKLNCTPDKLAERRKTLTTTASIVGPLLIICFSTAIGFLIYRVRKEQERVRLEQAKLLALRDGDPLYLNSSDFNSHIQSLPYDLSVEIPWDSVIMGTEILGAGAFGEVRKGFFKPAITSSEEVKDDDKEYDNQVQVEMVDLGTGSRTEMPNADADPAATVPEEIPIAVKTVKPGASFEDFYALLLEIKILAYLNHHENVIRLVGASTVSMENKQALAALEFCARGDLLNFLRGVASRNGAFRNIFDPTPPEIRIDQGNGPTPYDGDWTVLLPDAELTTIDLIKFCAGIAHGMAYLAEKKVIHGGLAARNILLTDQLQVKIADFGLARQLMMEQSVYTKDLQKLKLPWMWMSLSAVRDRHFSIQSDIWSFGVVCWEIFTLGREPYDDYVDGKFCQDLIQGLRLQKPDYANDYIFQLMEDCWHQDKDSRPPFVLLHQSFRLLLNEDLDALEILN